MVASLVAADLASGAPAPADAERRAERLLDAAQHAGLDPSTFSKEARHIATLACQAAPYLGVLIGRDPHRLLRVAEDAYLHREKPLDVLAAELAARMATVTTAAELRTALRGIRADELVRLGVRELELGLPAEVGRELARLADVCFDAAIAFHDGELRARYGTPLTDDGTEARLAVIGMGKLGGEELNFTSDVDVIYVYTSELGAAGALSLHEYFAKLCTQVTAAIAQVTDDELVFRVDLRLRPEGSRGAIALSLAQTERYYETFGRPWERQAWIKARACAGDATLGAETIAMLRPFVFPRIVSPTVIDDVHDLNRRIKRELVGPRAARGGFDVKNGEGGIREIEFFVQALQLIHAGKRAALRVRGTRRALDALQFAGLVTDDEHGVLLDAYRWLRHVEHVLQLEAGMQTQTLPEDDAHRTLVARRLRYSTLADFEAVLATHTQAVSTLFASLGDDTEEPAAAADLAAVLGGELTEADESATLARLGFVDLPAARAELVRARRGPGSILAPTTERDSRLGAALLREALASADPDQALRWLGELIARRGAGWSLWRLLDENPAIARLLGSLLGASEYLARLLVESPELIDLLVDLGLTAPTRTLAQIDAELVERLRAVDREDQEAVWSAIAEVKAGHTLRVGLADFSGALEPLAVCEQLTVIAEACLRSALGIVEAQLAERHGRPPGDARLAVLALGKLGGRELGYAADLDVVFVFASDDEAAETAGPLPLATIDWFSRCAQRLLGALRMRTPRGRLYEVDTRLRPSGSQGLLVSSIGAWRRYHAQSARTWERQALTKLRYVAGDLTLGRIVEAHAAATVYGDPPGDVHAIAIEIAAMRARIEKEQSGTRADRAADLKTGPGGVIDVEFAAQYLQLAHGHAHPGLRTTATIEALAAAAQAGVAPADEIELLAQGYRFLRGIENRLRVVNDRPEHRLPGAHAALDQLARRSRFPDGETLRWHVERWQREIRRAYTVLLGA